FFASLCSKPGVCRRRPPADIGDDRCDMQRRGAGDARFSRLARDIYAHAEAVAVLARPCYRADAAKLDRLEAYAARRLGLVVTADVVERVDALVGPYSDIGRGRDLCHAGEIIRRHRLLEEIEAGSIHGAHVSDGLVDA